MKQSVRVAAAQFHVGDDIAANLATCLRMLDEAAGCRPDLIVLPEFCNHLSWYESREHCYEVAVSLDGEFLAAIAAKAAGLGVYVAVNCTVKRPGGTATGSSLLYSPQGELLADNTKQIYIGHENDFLEKSEQPGPVVSTPLGQLGLYACMDGVICETPRTLALNGAQVMLNSFNSFASDEGSLHVPVRAAENKVYVVAANKVGPLVPEAILEGVSAATGIPPRFLCGAGESQIVAPDGEVLAIASMDTEEIIFADIEPARSDDKRRPDGTDIFRSRRPELYSAITADTAGQPLPPMVGARELPVALLQVSGMPDANTLGAEVASAVAGGARLVLLPPLVPAGMSPEQACAAAEPLLEAIRANAGSACVATAVWLRTAAGLQHCAVLVDAVGLALVQPQVHSSQRFADSAPHAQFSSLEIPGARVAVLTSDDTLYPETFRLLALQGVEVVLVPLAPLEAWELRTGLVERAAENRINLLACVADASLGGSLACNLQTDFTVLTEWREREFDGLLSQPELTRLPPGPGIYRLTLRPANASNKVVSANTDLLADRPWRASAVISRL
ncbi:carbon-nitrogen hydrolase family protein [Parahaliea maris]|uniref:Carbon-nitrogen hydrolase family protein n=1 Tax=Parahaliea maris TaxID=2716870 RepID=A0A5C9A8E8_9GAMM|nr:carbon-nitrogen hydrolase family protein [Parahaliea maris]TXS96409.1 carbon-nitrogen hydrolase family protein [Parahaliea maris]